MQEYKIRLCSSSYNVNLNHHEVSLFLCVIDITRDDTFGNLKKKNLQAIVDFPLKK